MSETITILKLNQDDSFRFYYTLKLILQSKNFHEELEKKVKDENSDDEYKVIIELLKNIKFALFHGENFDRFNGLRTIESLKFKDYKGS